jgi:hypothetical protein
MLLNFYEVLEKRLRGSNSLPKGVNDFLSYFSHLPPGLGEIRYKKSTYNAAEKR